MWRIRGQILIRIFTGENYETDECHLFGAVCAICAQRSISTNTATQANPNRPIAEYGGKFQPLRFGPEGKPTVCYAGEAQISRRSGPANAQADPPHQRNRGT